MAGSLGNDPMFRGLDFRYGGPTRPSGHFVHHYPHRPVGVTSGGDNTGPNGLVVPVRQGSPGGGGNNLPPLDGEWQTTYTPPSTEKALVASGEGATMTFGISWAGANALA